jgi:hypothetical protein
MLGTFVLGLLYVSGLTSLSSAALLFLMGRSQNIWLAGGVATLGAVVGDLVIFALFRSIKPFAASRPDMERYSGWWAAVEAHVSPACQSFVMMSVVVVFLLLASQRVRRLCAGTDPKGHPMGHAGHFQRCSTASASVGCCGWADAAEEVWGRKGKART